jgi:acetolactate synthase small subunit
MSRLIESVASVQTESTACFSVHAVASPGIMPRVLELFAKRGLLPSSWTSRVGQEQDLTIDIQMRGMEGELTDYVAACLRQIVGVEVVLVSQKQQRAAMQR